MKEWYYEKLRNKLKLLFDCGTETNYKITVRCGNKKIAEFSHWELQDLWILWKEESKKKWKVEPSFKKDLIENERWENGNLGK